MKYEIEKGVPFTFCEMYPNYFGDIFAMPLDDMEVNDSLVHHYLTPKNNPWRLYEKGLIHDALLCKNVDQERGFVSKEIDDQSVRIWRIA